jgi:hypothetical protein
MEKRRSDMRSKDRFYKTNPLTDLGNNQNRNKSRLVDMARVKCHKCQIVGHFARNCTNTDSLTTMRTTCIKPLVADTDLRRILIYGFVVWNSRLSRSDIRYSLSQLR